MAIRFVHGPSGYQGRVEWRVFVDVTIKRNNDGLTVVDVDKVGYPADHDGDLSAPEFMWNDGNYSCDCNRHLFFERALGNEPDTSAMECTHGRYTVIAPDFVSDRASSRRAVAPTLPRSRPE